MPAYPINTTVQLLHDVPLSPRMPHRIRFTSASARESYFAGKVYNSQTEIQLQRVDGIYRLPVALDDAIDACNYMRWQNKVGQWYYAFITHKEYMNPNLTRVEFEVDAWTTFQFDLTWGDCFIERECVSVDNIGTHTLPEDIMLGEQQYIDANISWPFTSSNGNIALWPCFILSEAYRDNSTATPYNIDKEINDVPNTTVVWAPAYPGESSVEPQDAINNFLAFLAEHSKLDAILFATAMPAFMFTLPGVVEDVVHSNDFSLGSYYIFANATRLTAQTTVDFNLLYNAPITANNNKVYAYPYTYYKLLNGQGDEIDLLPEYMQHDASDPITTLSLTFEYTADLSSTSCMMLYPTNYAGGNKYTHCSRIMKFPVLGITGNAFANWIAGNAATLTAGVANSLGQATIGIAEHGIAGAASGASGIISILASINDASKQPAVVKSVPGNSGNYMAGLLNFKIVRVTTKAEYLHMIDNYFSMYGYKVNRMGAPEFATRQYWNYYKIPSCVVYGDIPGDYLEQIRDLFINGVTLWNTTDVGNYHNGSNPIVGG